MGTIFPSRESILAFPALALAAMVVCLISATGWAQDYSLDFAVSGVSGEVAQAADYEVAEQVATLGVVVEVQSSADYSAAPVLEVLAESEPPSSVELWMLF